MNKKLSVIAAVALAAVTILVFYNLNWLEKITSPAATSSQPGNPSAPPNNSATVPATSTAGANTASPDDLASHAASPNPPATNEVQNLSPPVILDQARLAMHNYGLTFGENPVGTNPEITAALMGKNPKGINFITPESGLRVNENGEMLDGWGTPFFFHQISGKEMEIRSAGEDRKMWTFDDLVAR